MRNPAHTASKDMLKRENGIMKTTCSRKFDENETQKCKKGQHSSYINNTKKESLGS
jgi:hypothetical protein